jgi:hypothetical protein
MKFWPVFGLTRWSGVVEEEDNLLPGYTTSFSWITGCTEVLSFSEIRFDIFGVQRFGRSAIVLPVPDVINAC